VSLECLKTELGVATQCGRCADCASRILCDARSASASGMPMRRMHQAEQTA
jgi:bacterioferritin-associated ferredoxin